MAPLGIKAALLCPLAPFKSACRKAIFIFLLRNSIFLIIFLSFWPNNISRKTAGSRLGECLLFFSFCRFVSGSKDGTARIWSYKRRKWTSICLNMVTGDNREKEQVSAPAANGSANGTQGTSSSSSAAPRGGTSGGSSSRPAAGGPASSAAQAAPTATATNGQAQQPAGQAPPTEIQVFMLAWNIDDSIVITACSDTTIKLWDSHTGRLIGNLRGHEHEIFVLEPHPQFPNILLSSAFDGYFIIWDLSKQEIVFKHRNTMESPTR